VGVMITPILTFPLENGEGIFGKFLDNIVLSKGVFAGRHYLDPESHFDPSIILRTHCDRSILSISRMDNPSGTI
jgi:hypothetical protein